LSHGGDLLALNKHRSHAEFEGLMLPHLNAAYSLARWMMRHPEEAEDAVQDAYLRALEHFDRYQGRGEKAWLMTIVRNVCLTRLKRSRQSAKVVMMEDVLGEVEQVNSQNSLGHRLSEPEIAVIAKAERDEVHHALRRLPTSFREVLVLRELQELSYQEIAGIIGIPIGTVMSRLARARSALKSSFSRLEAENTHNEV
jgi:RNA polymerase sigma-70 factor, ECF subfamily